jgi:phage-related protein
MAAAPNPGSVGTMKRSRTFLVTGIAVAALAAGCGGDDETSATESWAGDVCSSVSTWQESIAAATESLQENPSAEGIQDAIDEIGEATRTLADDLEENDAPETESRTEADELLTTLADDLNEALDGVEQAVDDAEGAAGALEAGTAAVAALTTMGQQVSATVDELGQLDAGSELSDAFDNADACRDLRDER